jgi:hypothetical protein
MLSVALVVGACSGSVDFAGDLCERAERAAPTLTTPTHEARDVVPAELALEADSTDVDLADGAHEWEIWTVATDGTLVTRVWHAATPTAGPARAVLADGSFDEPFAALPDYSYLAARVRTVDAVGAACTSASAWSDANRFRTDDGSATLFDEKIVRDIYLDIPQSSIDAMNAEAVPPECIPWQRSFQPATVTFEDHVFEHVGVKIKGGCGSARRMDQKPGLKINLEWDDPSVDGCPGERRVYGQKHFTLNNQVQDQSAMHERLGYRFYRAMGVPAPRAAPIRVHVNGELYGLYLNVETVDRRFLSHRFDDEDGMLYEATYFCDLVSENVSSDADDKCLTREFSPDECSSPDPGADPEDYSPLTSLVDALAQLPEGQFYPEVNAVMDYDTFLSQWAADSVMAHWDGYSFDVTNNYRVYHDLAKGTWSMIPTGIDQTFDQDQDPWKVIGLLSKRCLAEKDCEDAFAARLKEARTTLVTLDLAAEANVIHGQIGDLVDEDPRKEYGMDTWEGRFSALTQWIADRPGQIDAYLGAHGY